MKGWRGVEKAGIWRERGGREREREVEGGSVDNPYMDSSVLWV